MELDLYISEYKRNINSEFSQLIDYILDKEVDLTLYSNGELKQLIFLCEAFINEKNHDKLAQIINEFKRYNKIRSTESFIFLKRENCLKFQLENLLDTVYCMNFEDINDKSDIDFPNLTKYLDTMIFNYEILNSAKYIVLLENKKPESTFKSYTFTAFPEFIYTDYSYGNEYLLAEALIHESTHLWLNDLLNTFNEKLVDSTQEFYSPWKETMRPAFGIIHAAFAFSQMIKYYYFVINKLKDDDPGVIYSRKKIIYDLKRMMIGFDSILSSLEVIKNQTVKEVIRSEIMDALIKGGDYMENREFNEFLKKVEEKGFSQKNLVKSTAHTSAVDTKEWEKLNFASSEKK